MEDSPLSLVEHLEELRYRIIVSLVAIASAAVVSTFFLPRIINFIAKPVGELVFIGPTDAFMARLKIALFTGLFLALPVVIYQAWKFVSVALQPREAKTIMVLVPVSYVLFVTGIVSSWFILPVGIKFLLGLGTANLKPMITIDAYMTFVIWLSLGFGLSYQLPVVLYLLGRIGIVNADGLSKYRRHALVIVLIVAGMLTPGPDIASQLLLGIPTYLLYEISIWVVRWTSKKQKTEVSSQ